LDDGTESGAKKKKKGHPMSLFCDSSQKERTKKASKEMEGNNSHVAMLLFLFTVSIPNSKPMPQVQISEWASRANTGTHSPTPLLCFCILRGWAKDLFNQRLNCSDVTKRGNN
jgi:hypothetical protein